MPNLIFFPLFWIVRLLVIYILLLSAAWGGTSTTNFNLASQRDDSIFTVNLSGKAEYKTFYLKNPYRLVIDIKDNTWNVAASVAYIPEEKNALVTQIRHGIQEGKHCRIVLDLSEPVSITRTDIRSLTDGSNTYQLAVGFKSSSPANKVMVQIPPPEKPVIVIDPGHGGDDPGTLGRFKGVYEKDVALIYGLALKAALEKENRYQVVLTRKGDYFVPLGARVAIARKKKVDLFISLHANSHPKEATSGLSVYTVSDNASDKEAELLAAKENKGAALQDINLSQDDVEMAPILITLMQRKTKNVSASFAEEAVAELRKEVHMLRNTHRFAGFKVLKGIDVPAVLFELGYLSNRKEERLLVSSEHRKKIITAMVAAINTHFSK